MCQVNKSSADPNLLDEVEAASSADDDKEDTQARLATLEKQISRIALLQVPGPLHKPICAALCCAHLLLLSIIHQAAMVQRGCALWLSCQAGVIGHGKPGPVCMHGAASQYVAVWSEQLLAREDRLYQRKAWFALVICRRHWRSRHWGEHIHRQMPQMCPAALALHPLSSTI